MQVDGGHRDQCCRQAMTCTCCTGRRDFQDSCAITSAWLIWTRERGYKSQSPFLAPPRSHVRLAKSMAQLRNTSESPLRVARTLPDLCATAHTTSKSLRTAWCWATQWRSSMGVSVLPQTKNLAHARQAEAQSTASASAPSGSLTLSRAGKLEAVHLSWPHTLRSCRKPGAACISVTQVDDRESLLICRSCCPSLSGKRSTDWRWIAMTWEWVF